MCFLLFEVCVSAVADDAGQMTEVACNVEADVQGGKQGVRQGRKQTSPELEHISLTGVLV